MKQFISIFILTGIFFVTIQPLARADEATVLSELEKLKNGQTQILQELDEIKAELQVVKVRASLKG